MFFQNDIRRSSSMWLFLVELISIDFSIAFSSIWFFNKNTVVDRYYFLPFLGDILAVICIQSDFNMKS